MGKNSKKKNKKEQVIIKDFKDLSETAFDEIVETEAVEPEVEATEIVEAVEPEAEATEIVEAEAAEPEAEAIEIAEAEPVSIEDTIVLSELIEAEKTDIPEPDTEENFVPEPEPVCLADPDIPEEAPAEAAATPEPEKKAALKKPDFSRVKAFFNEKTVTRKVLAATVVAAVLLNTALTAGLLGIFSHSMKKAMPKDDHNGRPEIEQFYDNDWGSDGNGGWNNDQNGGWNYDPDDDWDYGHDDDWDYGHDDDWDYDHDDDDRAEIGDNYLPDDDQENQSSSSKASIGIVITDNNGVYISQVTGDNARSAGLAEGDHVVAFNGVKITDSNTLISEVQKCNSGDKVTITVDRNGQQVEIKTSLE